MGADASHQLDPEVVEKMQQNTSFDGGEIKEWHKRFRELCPDGEMTREQFQVSHRFEHMGAYLGKGTYWQLITLCWLYFGVMFEI